MKTGKRSIPLDSLSVSEDGVSVSIHTHRQLISVSVDDLNGDSYSHSMSFKTFHLFLLAHVKDYGERAPSMMKGSRKLERSRSTGVEEGK